MFLDFLDIGFIESGSDTVLDTHVFFKTCIIESESSQNFQGRRGNTTLVGRGTLEKNDASMFKTETGFLGNEQVGTFNNVLVETVFNDLVDVIQTNRFRTTTARNEDTRKSKRVGVESVTEGKTVFNDGTVRQLDIVFIHKDTETISRELGGIKVADS